MPIVVTCSDCFEKLKAPDASAGKQVKCPSCGAFLDVPADSEREDRPPSRMASERWSGPPPRERFHKDDRSRARWDADEDGGRTYRRTDEPSTGVQMGLGIAALVLGVIGLVFDFIPCIGWIVSVPAASIGLILGVVALVIAAVRKWRGIGFPIAGTSVSLVALLGGLAWFGYTTYQFRQAQRQFQAAVQQQQAAMQQQQQMAAQMQQQQQQAEKDRAARELANLKAQGWVDASKEKSRIDDVEVRVVAVKFGAVAYQSFGQPRSMSQCTQITLSIRNVSAERKVEYLSWGSHDEPPGRANAQLVIRNFATIPRLKLVGARMPGVQSDTNIEPGGEVRDLVLFLSGTLTERARLELPGSAVGAPGRNFRFLIPPEMVQR